MNEKQQFKTPSEVAPVREAYQAPKLETLGAWKKLTRTLPGTGFGGGQGG